MSNIVPSSDEHLTARIEPPFAWLLIDNPERRNAVTLSMWQAMPALLAQIEGDSRVRVLVIAGAGETAFVAGADIGEFATVRRDAASARGYEDANAAAFAAIRTTRRPTIAMIRGFCFGGGIGIAAACDLRIAADDALFSIPAARLGLAYPPAAIGDIVRLVGAARAKEMFFTARRIDHAEAHAIGLVDRVVPAAELESETRALAASIADNAPLTLVAAKAAIDAVARGESTDPATALADACFESADFAEGRAAFLEKRRPRFSGT